MKLIHFFLCMFALLIPAGLQAGSEPFTRVACVGDSITFGLNIPDREKASYPAVLGSLLGPRYEVRNFGVSGATLLKKGDYPYWVLPEFLAALEYAPNIVVIMLGTNDSKMNNASHRGDLETDLGDLIDRFAALPTRPNIWVCTPPPLFGVFRSIHQVALEREIVPKIQAVAAARKIPVIDFQSLLSQSPELFPDGCHPNADGAKRMADAVFKVIISINTPL